MFFLLSVLEPQARQYSEHRPGIAALRILVQPLLLEYQRIFFELGGYPIPRDEIAAQNLLCQGVLDLRLNGALQGPRPIDRVEAGLADLVACVIVQAQGDVALRQPQAQSSQLDIDDRANLLAPERMEHHDLIDSIDEFRPEMLRHH